MHGSMINNYLVTNLNQTITLVSLSLSCFEKKQNIEVREETTVVTTTGSMGDVIGGTERIPIGAGVGIGASGVGADLARIDTPRLDAPRNDIPRGGSTVGDVNINIPRGEVRDFA